MDDLLDQPQLLRVWQYRGTWCIVGYNGFTSYVGYVLVELGHPWYERDMTSIDANVHGGVTFSGYRDWDDWQGDGAPSGWYVGFDCGHWNDLYVENSPMHRIMIQLDSEHPRGGFGPGSIDWTPDMVAIEVERLARQKEKEAYGSHRSDRESVS